MRPLSITLVSIAAASCAGGSPSSSPPADSAVAAGDTAPVEETPPTCGTNVGDILCDLPLEGYIRDGVATGLAPEAPYVSAKLSEIVARGTQKYAFIWTSSYW